MSGALAGKYASVFVSTGTPGGGQEMTVNATLSTLTHHGIIFVPLGYSTVFPLLTNTTEVHGGTFLFWNLSHRHQSDPLFSSGSPWGAGTFAGADGSRLPTPLELEIARAQGKLFWETVSKVKF